MRQDYQWFFHYTLFPSLLETQNSIFNVSFWCVRPSKCDFFSLWQCGTAHGTGCVTLRSMWQPRSCPCDVIFLNFTWCQCTQQWIRKLMNEEWWLGMLWPLAFLWKACSAEFFTFSNAFHSPSRKQNLCRRLGKFGQSSWSPWCLSGFSGSWLDKNHPASSEQPCTSPCSLHFFHPPLLHPDQQSWSTSWRAPKIFFFCFFMFFSHNVKWSDPVTFSHFFSHNVKWSDPVAFSTTHLIWMFPPLLLLLTPQLLHIFVLLLSLPPLNVLHVPLLPHLWSTLHL